MNIRKVAVKETKTKTNGEINLFTEKQLKELTEIILILVIKGSQFIISSLKSDSHLSKKKNLFVSMIALKNV